MKLMNKTAVFLAVALTGGLLLAAPALAAPAEKRDTITVNGMAERQVAPDTAYVTVGVVTQNTTVEAARAENARSIARIAKTLADYGISGQAVKTSSFNLYPNYSEERNEQRRVVGYTMENSLTVELKNLDKIGTVIDALFAAGANRLDGVRFAVAGYDALQDELLKEAVADGYRKANLVARSAGRNVGKLANAVINSGGGSYQPEYRMAKSMAANDATQIFGGGIKLSASVQLAYELE